MLVLNEQSVYVGPAWVRQTAGRRLELELPNQTAWAEMALPFPYQATRGDTVLAIGQEEQWYVIGVLKGSGLTMLSVPGDLSIQALHGHIDIRSAKGINLRGPTVKVLSRRLELMAETLCERFTEASRWVKEALQIRAGDMRTITSGSYSVRAKRISERAKEDVKIDGTKIHLG